MDIVTTGYEDFIIYNMDVNNSTKIGTTYCKFPIEQQTMIFVHVLSMSKDINHMYSLNIQGAFF